MYQHIHLVTIQQILQQIHQVTIQAVLQQMHPSDLPSDSPTNNPSISPSESPTNTPTNVPTENMNSSVIQTIQLILSSNDTTITQENILSIVNILENLFLLQNI